MRREQQIEVFVEELWNWYSNHKRVLPWRDLQVEDDTQRAYMVLVSEIMLQQTQVPRVIIVFKNFLERFPTLKDLAQASNRDVLIAWRGMGYNSRALRLRDAAKVIIERVRVTDRVRVRKNDPNPNPNPEFPRSMEDLMAIPGIGPYTAAAIRNFAFNIPTPCIDTNIRRILHRVFVGPENADGTWEKDDGYLLKIASEVLEVALQSKSSRSVRGAQRSRRAVTSDTSVTSETSGTSDWHATLMDFGSLVQTKRNPKWEICPLTAKGIMKTTKKSFELRVSHLRQGYGGQAGYGKTRNSQLATRNRRREPGRFVGSVFIPNRIFRGRVVEALRDAKGGLTLQSIGKRISIDWEEKEHAEWLQGLLAKLERDRMITSRNKKFLLEH